MACKKMKVLHIINNLATGGAEKLILETVPIFNAKNITCDVLVINGTEYPFLKELKKINCCSIFSLTNGSIYNPFIIFKLIKYIKKYDIIHVHLFPALYFVAIAKILSFSSCKLIFTEHSTSNKRMRNFVFKYLDRIFYKPYNKIITISEKVDSLIKNHLKFNSNKFLQIKNGVNIQKINEAKPIDSFDFLPNRENFKIILQVSSFQVPKDQKTVIKSLKLLPENVILFLIGVGELKIECEEFVKKENLCHRVYFLGQRMDVPNLLKSVDIIVLSSHYEGLSLSSVEGLASSKPFIATNVQGLKEVVENAGLLFEKNNENELAVLINKLLINKEYYNAITQKCIERAKEYDIENTVNQTIRIYKKYLNEK
jgi:glycosyltransferase involved in cell wall biosynthesis